MDTSRCMPKSFRLDNLRVRVELEMAESEMAAVVLEMGQDLGSNIFGRTSHRP